MEEMEEVDGQAEEGIRVSNQQRGCNLLGNEAQQCEAHRLD